MADGAADPYNREALWPSNYTNTSTYTHIAKLNSIRHALISNNTLFSGQNFLDSTAKIVESTATDVAIRKGPLLAVLTNVSPPSSETALMEQRGSPSQSATFGVTGTGWTSQTNVIE